MNQTIKKSIEIDDVALFSSSLIDKDFVSLTLNQTISIDGVSYTNPNVIQYIILQDKPLCLTYIIQSSPEFRGLSTLKKPSFYITDHQYNFLHLAVNVKAYKCIGVLLESTHSRPEMINETTKEGMTPLHMAAKSDLPTIVAKLLQYGANPLMKDKNNYTPLHYAILHSTKSTEVIGSYLQRNFPRSFFYILHKPIGQFNDMIEFAEKNSKVKNTIMTIQYFEQRSTDTPAADEPEPVILEFKSNPNLQTNDHSKKARSKASNYSQTIEGCTCNSKCCIHYKRLRKCHICEKVFCPLHISDHSHQRSDFFG